MPDDTVIRRRPLIPPDVREDLTDSQANEVETAMREAEPPARPGPASNGEIAISISVDPRAQQVVLDFGISVKWLSFTPAQARDVARLLMDKADVAQRVM